MRSGTLITKGSLCEIGAGRKLEQMLPSSGTVIPDGSLPPLAAAPNPAGGQLPRIEIEAAAPAAPRVPGTLEEAGLTLSLVEQLILKILYFRGDLLGRDLAQVLGLKFSLIQETIEKLKLQHTLEVKRSLGMGNVTSLFALTESGRNRARLYLESNQYAGAAPVPLDQYAEVVRTQRPKPGWLTPQNLAQAYSRMVLSERILSQLGPAISSGSSFLIYGKPGDGKTYLAEALADLDPQPVYIPYAIEYQGNIIQVYDPIYHRILGAEGSTELFLEPAFDARWFPARRPFIMSGGELTLDMLDLSFNSTSRVYEAPLQLKANNGIYLVDDFGRQRATPAEVLNRWIVPMERRVDYLSFQTGGKIALPFEVFLVFSTNLKPEQLGDEAFLRRLQYKMYMQSPDETEFREIFQRFCTSQSLTCPEALLADFIDRHYRRTGKPFRRCHPRDVLTHALNLLRFHGRELALNAEVLDEAFASCFVQESFE